MNRFGSPFKQLMWFMALLLAAFVAGCGGGGDSSAPKVAGPPPVDPAGGVCDATVSTGCVNLKTAGTYVILAQAGTTNVPTSAVTGNIGVSPIKATGMTGYSETLDASGTFSTSAQVTGKLFASDYTAPTPANLTAAVADSIAAYTDAAGRAPGTINLGAGNIGGLTLAPGVYHWTTGVSIPTDVTISGSPTDVWIFQVTGNLTEASAKNVILAGGAMAKNIFWQVSGSTAIGTTAHFEGIIITPSSVALATGASTNGRLFTGTAVTLDGNTVTRPAP